MHDGHLIMTECQITPLISDQKVIGTWATLDELVLLLRRRAHELNAPRLSIDEVAGLPSGYAAKVLSPKGTGKHMGIRAMQLMITALGMTMVAIENRQAMSRHTSRLQKRQVKVNAGSTMPAQKRKKRPGFSLIRGNPAAARRLRSLQLIRTSVKARKLLAKRAAKIRWARHRAKLRATKDRPACDLPARVAE
jgi:hypothetical protein